MGNIFIMKNNFKNVLVAIITSIIFYACSKSEDQLVLEKNDVNTTSLSNKSSRIALVPTVCDISGSLTVNNGSYTYSYTNNTNNTNINWIATPSTGVTISGQGTSTITITFNSNFNSCTLKAIGTGGIDACEKTITINRATVTCCSPTFDAFYICDGTVKGKGAVVPFVQGCDVSTISKIVWSLGGAKWIAGPLAGQGGGTMLPPFNQYVKNIGYYQCQYGMFRISATYYFNNGCPPSTYNLDVTPTN